MQSHRGALTDAQIVWVGRRAGLEAKIADARISMEYYRRQTFCELTMGARDFDNKMSVFEKRRLIEDRPVQTAFQRWQYYSRDYARALEWYDEFRGKEAEFQSKYRARWPGYSSVILE